MRYEKMTEINTENFKHIVLCVDQTPSMNRCIQGKSIIEIVNKGVAAFINVFNEKNVKSGLTSLTFDTECHISQEVSIDGFKVEYSAKKNGKACVADTLNKAANILAKHSNGYVIFISDGMLEPDETESDLVDAINSLERYRCYTVGFITETGDSSLKSLLDYYTNKQIIAFNDHESYIKALVSIAEDIIKDEGKTVSEDDKKKDNDY